VSDYLRINKAQFAQGEPITIVYDLSKTVAYFTSVLIGIEQNDTQIQFAAVTAGPQTQTFNFTQDNLLPIGTFYVCAIEGGTQIEVLGNFDIISRSDWEIVGQGFGEVYNSDDSLFAVSSNNSLVSRCIM
jgi:hypothetical protein